MRRTFTSRGPSWKMRRRAVFGSLVASWSVIGLTLWRGADTSLAETTVLGAFALIGTIVATYIGGAAYEDVQLDRNSQPRSDTYDV